MNSIDAINYIHSIPKFIRPLGNANLAGLLDRLGSPQKGLKFIHIAGTNGKGSTASIIAQILYSAGYKTGLFTSPFIEVFNERIRINGENISDTHLGEYTSKVKNAMEESGCNVSEFAFITAVAFLYFKDTNCDYVVLETGMGGKLDATNIIDTSEVSVLTSISLDHMQFLGDTIEEIATEKCGIIKENGIVVTYPNEAVMDIIEDSAKSKNARLIKTEKALSDKDGFVYKSKHYPLSLKGEYQPQNAAVALEAIFALHDERITEDAIIKGLTDVRWPARFEFLRDNLVIDGGHNIDGIRVLKKSLLALKCPIILVMAMMEDKSYIECIEEITPIADYIFASELPMPRCLDADELLKHSKINGEVQKDCVAAVKKALDMADDNTVVCVCGSLYLAGEIRKSYS